jgi:NTE family protein
MKRRFKVGLALGGGAARGLAHLGVLRVLERNAVPIDLVAGTCMGALIGAMYCATPRVEKIIERMNRFFTDPQFTESKIHYLKRSEEDVGFFESVSNVVRRGLIIGSSVARASFLDREDLFDLMRNFVDDRDIRGLQIPLCIIACDLMNSRQIVFSRGPIIDAVAASSAVAGAFPPIKVGDCECIDGGVVNMVPVSVARDMGADVVIAVNVSHEMLRPPEMRRGLEIYFRTQEITKQTLIALQVAEAEVVITPPVGAIHWADFTAAERIIEVGEETAKEALPQIRQALEEAGRFPLWRSLLGRTAGKR